MTVPQLNHDDLVALYGRWADRRPEDVAQLFDGYDGVWWIAGGWAIEAFTEIPRHHDDIDPSVLRHDLPRLRRHLEYRLHLWAAAAGTLTPLIANHEPEAEADNILPLHCGQVWTRADADGPWEYDILLNPGSSDEWIYKRDNRIRLPMSHALWSKDGIRYLKPELQLLLKSRGLRAKDQFDFDVTLPLLESSRREWLHQALTQSDPGHPWIAHLAGH